MSPPIKYNSKYRYDTQTTSNSYTPTITNGTYNANGSVYLQWDTPIPPEDIFLTDDLESYYLDNSTGLKTGTWEGMYPEGNGWLYNRDGTIRPPNDRVRNSLRLLPGLGVNNSKGFMWKDTLPNHGWRYTHHLEVDTIHPSEDTIINSSGALTDIVQLEIERPIIIRADAKGSGDFWGTFSLGWTGNSNEVFNVSWDETLSSEEYIRRLREGVPIRVNNGRGGPLAAIHNATALCTDYTYNFHISYGNILLLDDGYYYFVPTSFHEAWNEAKPGQVVAGPNRLITAPVKGQPLYQADHSGDYEAYISNVSGTQWNTYSANTNIPRNKMIEANNRYFNLKYYGITPNTLQVDNISFAYAPLSKIYRDNQLIMNNKYTVEFTDTTAKDTASPTTPTNPSSTVKGTQVELNWGVSTDTGRTYSYTATSVNTGGVESPKSNPVQVTALSGLYGYEVYVDNVLHGASNTNSYSLPLGTSFQNVEILAIDHSGNRSTKVAVPAPTPATPNIIAPSSAWTNKDITVSYPTPNYNGGVAHSFPYWNPFTNSWQSTPDMVITKSTSGNKFFKVRNSNGRESLSQSLNVVVNIEKFKPSTPNITISGTPFENPKFQITNIKDDLSGVNKVEYKISNDVWKEVGFTNESSIILGIPKDLTETKNIDIISRITDNAGNVSELGKTIANTVQLFLEVPLSLDTLKIAQDSNTTGVSIPVKNKGTPVNLSIEVSGKDSPTLQSTRHDDTYWKNLTYAQTNRQSQMIINLKENNNIIKPITNQDIIITPENTQLGRMRNGDIKYNLDYYTGYSRKENLIKDYKLVFKIESVY